MQFARDSELSQAVRSLKRCAAEVDDRSFLLEAGAVEATVTALRAAPLSAMLQVLECS